MTDLAQFKKKRTNKQIDKSTLVQEIILKSPSFDFSVVRQSQSEYLHENQVAQIKGFHVYNPIPRVPQVFFLLSSSDKRKAIV